jgi:D-alanyl-D-alanine carboxypeptidase/D-alanyl-D-alanine-endopeptidase (penicillin-binding protein 4)
MLRCLITLVALSASGASLLEQRLDEILRTSKVLAPAEVGIEVVQLRSGKVLYFHDADKLFTPASNTKLFSTALALMRLGRDYQLRTRVYVNGGPDIHGLVAGDLVFYGTGDPSMSERVIPYDPESKGTDPMTAIEELADQILAKGVREIRGSIVGDDTAFPYEPVPPGWGAGDGVWEYGAPVSALTFNHGMFKVTVHPGFEEGSPARLELSPPLEYFAISNRTRTLAGTEQKINFDRPGGSRQIRVTGTVKPGAEEVVAELAVDDPALYAAFALTDALTRRGVIIRGVPTARHREPGEVAIEPAGRVIAERNSPALVELARVVDKVSQNLWAELMFRAVAKARTGDGSREAALDELKKFLNEIGAAKEDFVFEDGSGLSRLTLVTPSVINRLLRHMYLSPLGEDWKTLFPIGAVDGSLKKRFDHNPAAKAVLAKTGSLSHVNALSGYTESATYGEISFSILVNHTSSPADEVRAAIDKLALALLE